LIDTALIVFFGVWLLASLEAQRENSITLRLDFLGFIPSCRFFAPQPVTQDVRVYFRVLAAPNAESSIWWPLEGPPRSLADALWAPGMRWNKALSTSIRSLLRASDRNPRMVNGSLSYLRLLNCITARAVKLPDARFVQFIITKHSGFEADTRIRLFTSSVHAI
jgi:hypothetical protein